MLRFSIVLLMCMITPPLLQGEERSTYGNTAWYLHRCLVPHAPGSRVIGTLAAQLPAEQLGGALLDVRVRWRDWRDPADELPEQPRSLVCISLRGGYGDDQDWKPVVLNKR